MPKCNYCKAPGISYRFDENQYVNRQWDNNRESWHNCDQNPNEIRKRLDNWHEKFDKKIKYLVPIYCSICDFAYRPDTVCGHILKDGFKEGKDTVDFYSDSPKKVQRRNLIKKELKNTPRSTNQNIKTFF